MNRFASPLLTLMLAAPLWAAGELQFHDPALTGQTLYGVVWNASGQAWNGTAFATYDTTRATWDVPMAEIGATGRFTVNFPAAIAAGNYQYEIFQDANDDATPSHTDDIQLATGGFYWSGTAVGVNTLALAGSLVQQSGGYIGVNWGMVLNPTTTLGLTNTTVGTVTAVSGHTVTATNVDPDHEWRFDEPTQTTAPNDVTEITGSPIVLASMNFSEPLPAASSISTITAVTVADVSGAIEPTVTSSSIHTAKRKVVVNFNTVGATAATYTVSVVVVTTDSQTYTRKGRLVLIAQ